MYLGSIFSLSCTRGWRGYGRRSLAGFTKRMHDATSYQISVSTPLLSLLPSPTLSLFLSSPPPVVAPFLTRFAPSRAALHALLPSLDISDSKHNSNPGGLYARRGNSSVATQSSSLIEISYPLTYLPAKPHLGYARLVHSNVRHPEYFLLQKSAITRLRRHFSFTSSSPVEPKNDPRGDSTSLTRGSTSARTHHARKKTKRPSISRSCGQSRESEGASSHRKKLAKYGGASAGTLRTLKIAMVFKIRQAGGN